MIKIIKFIIHYSIGFIFYFDKLSRYTYKLVFNAFTIQLKTLPLREVFSFFFKLLTNKLTDNSILSKVALPLGLNWKYLCDTKLKKNLLLGFTSALIFYRWFIVLKKVLLWPFKLGVFSFFFSIFGLDLSWFLGFFDLFYVNIPQLIYFQYLILYSNWMNWWSEMVDIKSLRANTLFKKSSKEILTSDEQDQIEPENKINKKRLLITLTVVALIGIGIWYYFYSDFNGGASSSSPDNYGDNHQIEIKDNQTPDLKGKGRARLRRTGDTQPSSIRSNRFFNNEPSGSSVNRFTLLDTLDQLKSDGPPSPTGSTDSTETITPNPSKSSRPSSLLKKK